MSDYYSFDTSGPEPWREMSWPVICRVCQFVHDMGRVTVVGRYADCSAWRCPSCDVLIDDRSPTWGGCVNGQQAREILEMRSRRWAQ